MSKELDFLHSRGVKLQNHQEFDWQEALKIFKGSLEGEDICTINKNGEIREIIIDPIQEDDIFDVYTYSKCMSDSTLLFLLENIAIAVSYIYFGYTYDLRKYSNEQMQNSKKIVYKVGKVITSEYLDNEAKDFRNYSHEVFIPYKMEIIE